MLSEEESRLRLLVIEDETKVACAIRDGLEHENYGASGGAELWICETEMKSCASTNREPLCL